MCPIMRAATTRRKQKCSARYSFLTSLHQFQVPFAKTQAGQSGRGWGSEGNAVERGVQLRDKELLPKGREREVFVCGPVCVTGVPLHSLTGLKYSTNQVAYVQCREPTVIPPVWGELGAWKKGPS